MRIDSRLIHGTGPSPDGGVLPAIQLSSTFIQPTDGTEGEWVYQRGGNPTRDAAEKLLASMEDAEHAVLFSTGMAASSAVFSIVKPGEKVLLCRSVYGGTYRYVTTYFERYGISYDWIDDPNLLTAADVTPDVALVFIETPSNPTLDVMDIAHVAKVAHEGGALLAVDNTFLTAYLQRPLDLGADICVYSATKYLGGHADLLAGLVVTNDDELAEEFKFYRKTYGGALSPFDAFSLIRGVKTLSVRLDRQQENTHRVIDFLKERPEIVELNYPGSKSPEEAAIQARQAAGTGAVISFRLAEGADRKAFLDNLGFIRYAVSLGGVETLICTPATQTHEAYTPEHRAAARISDDLFRLAIGIEDIADIIELLSAGLAAATAEIHETN